jgi:hypothetical protein
VQLHPAVVGLSLTDIDEHERFYFKVLRRDFE